MTIHDATESAFLIELNKATQGDPAAKTTMQIIGAAIGLDKEQAGKTAENLIGKGLVEIKTLSGGIGITADGVEAARKAGGGPVGGSDHPLSQGPILVAEDCQVLEKVLADIKRAIVGEKSDYARIEEMVMDIKTMEVHLLSPKPKTAVIKALLRALQTSMEKIGAKDIAGRLKAVVG